MRRLCSDWSLGVLLIVIVAFIWNAASVLVQLIFTDYSFFRPFFLTYLANSLFIVTLPLRSLGQLLRGFIDRVEPVEVEAYGDGSCASSSSLRVTARAALVVCPFWFLANFSYNWSLGMTSVTSSTVISSSSAAFTLLLSVGLLGERPTLLKLLGVLLCWAGNVLTVLGDGGGSSGGRGAPPAAPPSVVAAQPVLGDALCLFSAVMYAVYTTAIRHFAPEDMALFFGLLGSFNCVLLAPVVVVLHLTSAESLASLTAPVLGLIILKGLVDNVLSDYLWARAVILTSPSVATVGLSLTIPMAIASEVLLPPHWMLAAAPPSALDLVACGCVVAGFVLINHASQQASAAADAPLCHCTLRVPLLRPRAATDPESEADGRRPAEQLPSVDNALPGDG